MYGYTKLVAQEAESLQRQKKPLPETEVEMHALFKKAFARRQTKGDQKLITVA